MRQHQVVLASSFLLISSVGFVGGSFANDMPEEAVSARIDECIRLLEMGNYDEFFRDCCHPDLVAAYTKARAIDETPKTRTRAGRYWLKMLRLVQGEDVHVANMGTKASLDYGRQSWSIGVQLMRKDDVWLLSGIDEMHMLWDMRGPDGDPRILVDSNRRSKLHREAMAGNFAEVKQCVRLEWNMFAKDKDGNTPLMLAEEAGHKEVAEFLQRRMNKKAIE